MDLLRKALGERKLNYFGYSYGTLLGATYASLFPNNYRAMVLDGPLDADGYINNPLHTLSEQTSGFERALGRFLQACAAHQDACSGFGGDDPMLALRHADRRRRRGADPGRRLRPGPAAGRRRRHPGRGRVPALLEARCGR